MTILHSFTGTDGDYPGALVQGVGGSFYGTTENGGADNDGTVYKITPSGALTTLHVFDGVDGKGPGSGLLLARDGNFYGTTIFGGTSSLGTVFKIDQTDSFTSLHSFLGSPTEGYEPGGALIQATDGYFYGLTQLGGAQSGGTIYKMAADDGFAPAGALVQGTSGLFYGVTIYGGAQDEGTLFSADFGLGPFVELRPRSGKVGATVQVLGTNLQGATAVAFDGVSAAFVVGSPSLILARVPAGASSGRVVVRTSAGPVVSNIPFKVK